MKYIDYKEHRNQGSFNFPIAFYHETPNSPRYYMPYHWHTHYEIIRIISGCFHLTLNNETKIYGAGDVIFISSGILHGGTPSDCIYECIVFDLSFFLKENHVCNKFIQQIINQTIIINTHLSHSTTSIYPIVSNLCYTLSSKKTGYEFLTQGYLYMLIGAVLEHHLYEENNEDITTTERLNSIKKVLTYISDNYNNNISLDTLARIAGMNSKYFCRYFKGMTERTPIDYLNYYRVECACEMLSTKDILIKEVAISCGFNDESYFIKTFQKYKGITPKQFMKTEFY